MSNFMKNFLQGKPNKKEENNESKGSNSNVLVSSNKSKIISDDPSEDEVKIKLNSQSTNFKNPQPEVDSIKFSVIVNSLNQVEQCKGENSQDRKKNFLSEIFFTIIQQYPNDLIYLFNFLNSKIGPEYRCPELGIGKETLQKCVSKSIGISLQSLKEKMKEKGDLSIIAMEGKLSIGTVDKFKGFGIKQNSTELKLKQIMEEIYKLTTIKGKDSMDEKEKILLKLMFASKPDELKFIIRCLEKSFKIGASFKTLMAALSRAISKYYEEAYNMVENEKEIDKIIQRSIYQLCDYDIIMHNIIEQLKVKESFSNLSRKCNILPGVPLKPMLAKPTTGVNMVANRFEGKDFSCEFKYDGFRGQIHYVKDRSHFSEYVNNKFLNELNLFSSMKIQIFSRNLENMTGIYPDIVEYFSTLFDKSDKVTSCILDCEIVPFDSKTNKILPFQVLTTRSRINVKAEDISVHVCCFLFDIIYLNQKDMTSLTLEQRRDILKDNFVENENVKITKFINSQNHDEIMEFMDDSIKAGCEGLIVKALREDSQYEPGARNFNWLKLKKDYLKETTIGDSLDLVPIGAEYGKGKRTGFYGSFLLACYNEDNENFEIVSMTGAGLKDEDLKSLYNILSENIIDTPLKSYKVSSGIKVDVWFEPKLVFEIKTADLSLSPIYTASSELVDNDNKGISLRFPRFIRLREDKKPSEATSSEQLYKMFKEQAMNEDNIRKYDESEDDD